MWRNFKSKKTAYVSFVILVWAYALSFVLPLFIGRNALVVRYQERFYFPVINYYEASVFGQNYEGETNYRQLKIFFGNENNTDFVVMPLYPYGPEENLLDEIPGNPPHPPSGNHFLGTDESGRDVFAKIFYGFRLSFTFSLLVTFLSFFIGIVFGSVSGYFKGWLDITGQRIVEIWSTVPFLYLMMLLASLLKPGFFLLVLMLTLFGWMGISLYVRGEFFREISKDYVLSAVAAGTSNFRIIVRHILPNALTPVLSFLPFVVVANISALVSLDFLGFGIPPPAPSWGNMISQGLNNLNYWWLSLFPLCALIVTLLLIVFIGEGFRYAFSPEGKILNTGTRK
jgi:microcin C transport system permease protein